MKKIVGIFVVVLVYVGMLAPAVPASAADQFGKVCVTIGYPNHPKQGEKVCAYATNTTEFGSSGIQGWASWCESGGCSAKYVRWRYVKLWKYNVNDPNAGWAAVRIIGCDTCSVDQPGDIPSQRGTAGYDPPNCNCKYHVEFRYRLVWPNGQIGIWRTLNSADSF